MTWLAGCATPFTTKCPLPVRSSNAYSVIAKPWGSVTENNDAAAILSGRALDVEGIQGAVESDFFDWILELADGRDLVLRIARQTSRFRLRDVEVDVLKSLYESLIDPAKA